MSAQFRIVEGPNLNIGGNNISYHGSYYGNAIGSHNQVYSLNALAVGEKDTISTSSSNSVTLGMFNYISGEASIAFGYGVRILADHCVTIGSGIMGAHSPDAYLINTIDNSLGIGFNSILPTLFVSEAPNDVNHNIVDKTGRVGIGNTAPQAKLHITSDGGEDAGIILEPATPTANKTFIQLRDATHGITVTSGGDMSVSAGYNNLMDISSSNFCVAENKMDLGLDGDRRIFVSSEGTPSISSNANPEDGEYSRVAVGPAYTMEFGSGTGFRLRTALDGLPDKVEIDNWRDAFIVKTDGAITLNGRVGVNTENTTNGYALAVDGGVVTTKVHIQDVSDWPDYVFGDGYSPMATGELKAYIGEHRHLPGVPSEAEVRADGYDVAEMQAVLLGKIEELTLYLLRQQDEIDSLRTLVTVHYGYDACGNRTSRTIAFSKAEGPGSPDGGVMPGEDRQWQASLRDSFAGGDAMLFPNPTEGGFILSLTGGDLPGSAKATLCTIDGKVIEERTLSGATEEFDLGGKPAGVYLLRLASEHETKVWKVIKGN